MAQQTGYERRCLSPRVRSRRVLFAFLCVGLLTMWAPQSAQAQVLYGTLLGNVTDSTGAAITGATVVATNSGTGIAKTATTDNTGSYRLSDLEPGAYEVSVTANRFAKETSKGIVLQANAEFRFAAELKPASVGQTVTVTAAPPDLQTDNATPTSELETAQVQNLITTAGVNERNFQSLFLLIPGFSPPAPTHSESGNPAQTMIFNANGMSGSNNFTRIDGVSDIYPWLPEITAYTPSLDAIASVNVVSNSMNPEQGFASGAAINVTTKSGTNQYHGSAWE